MIKYKRERILEFWFSWALVENAMYGRVGIYINHVW
jgi:hypothetical protein